MPPTSPTTRRTGIFHRESTRLRSNVADQVQRDLLPAGRMLSVFLVLCELLAEVAVLFWSRGKECDRPLRFWVFVLIMLQAGTVVLNCLNIWHGRDSFGQHRNGLSASDLGMYTDTPTSSIPSSTRPQERTLSNDASPDVSTASMGEHVSGGHASMVVVDVANAPPHNVDNASEFHFQPSDTQPLINPISDATATPALISLSSYEPSSSSLRTRDSSPHPSEQQGTSHLGSGPRSRQPSPGRASRALGLLQPSLGSTSSSNSPTSSAQFSSISTVISSEFVDRYVRIVNAWYLVWFILGSVWVSDRGMCSTTAPHLYRLVVALAIIYYALLFLPLACFCLIVCCLPLFILVYRIMLPYAERERRRARAADPAQVQNLNSIVYSAATFATHASNESVEDASCVICLCEYEPNEIVRFLPCKHHFHKECVDVWLRLDKACCLCKQDIDSQTQNQPMSSPV